MSAEQITPTTGVVEAAAGTGLVRRVTRSQLAARQDVLARNAGLVGFAAAGGLTGALRLVTLGTLGRPPMPGSPRLGGGRNNLGPALVTLAAANQQLLAAAYGRRSGALRKASLLAAIAAGAALVNADEEQRTALLEQGQAMLTPAIRQGEAILERTGILDRILGV